MNVRLAVVCAGFVAIVPGCQGAEGPMGPPGQDGVANRVLVTAVANGSGVASVTLSAAVGINPMSPPALTCYEGNPSILPGIWLSVSDGYSDTSSWCAVSFGAGTWTVSTHSMTPGWTAAWVVTY
jgi:hypothetical protein